MYGITNKREGMKVGQQPFKAAAYWIEGAMYIKGGYNYESSQILKSMFLCGFAINSTCRLQFAVPAVFRHCTGGKSGRFCTRSICPKQNG
jgi:hypothetical protein